MIVFENAVALAADAMLRTYWPMDKSARTVAVSALRELVGPASHNAG